MYLFITIPVQFISFFPFLFITCTMSFRLVYWGNYRHISTRKGMYLFTLMLFFGVTTNTYLSPQLLLYLPIDVPVHDPTFLITVKNYPSMFPLFYMSTDVPFHQYTCSVHFSSSSFFRHNLRNDLSTHILGYVHTNPPESKCTCLPSCFSSNHKGLPVTTTTCVHAHRCTRS